MFGNLLEHVRSRKKERKKKFSRHPFQGRHPWIKEWIEIRAMDEDLLSSATDLLSTLWGVCSQSWLLLQCNQKLFFQIVLVIQFLFGLMPWNGNVLLLFKLHKRHYVKRKFRKGKMWTTTWPLKSQLGPLSTGHVCSFPRAEISGLYSWWYQSAFHLYKLSSLSRRAALVVSPTTHR